jgi:hypothetical protein
LKRTFKTSPIFFNIMILPITILVLITSLFMVNAAFLNDWDIDQIFAKPENTPTLEELNKCVNVVSKALLGNMSLETDLDLLRDILVNDMHLHDMPAVRRLLASDLNKKQSLQPLLDQIRKGVTELHPNLGIGLCASLQDETTAGVFANPDRTMIRRSLHHMILLNKIVEKLANNVEFMVDVQKHIQDTIHSMTPHKSLIGHVYDLFRAGGLFGVAKAFTIDGAISDYKTFRERGHITKDEVNGRTNGLTLNILEATASDFAHGHFSNARVGNTLAWWHPTDIRVVGEKKNIEYVGSMDYARLYETWNFAFITGNLDFPNLLYPKLLIPRVLLASGNDYLYNRVLALWLSINFYLMADLEGKEHVTFEGSRELAELWGRINLAYSRTLHQPSTDESTESLDDESTESLAEE